MDTARNTAPATRGQEGIFQAPTSDACVSPDLVLAAAYVGQSKLILERHSRAGCSVDLGTIIAIASRLVVLIEQVSAQMEAR